MEWGLLLLGLVAAVPLCVLVSSSGRARTPFGRETERMERVDLTVGPLAGCDLVAEDHAVGQDRLGRCLAGLLAEPEEPAVAPPGLFTVWEGEMPPLLAAGLSRLETGLAGGTALSRLQDPAVGPKILAGIIGADPVLTGNVLRIANSPFFGPRSRIVSLEQAIGILGLGNLKTLLYTELLERAAVKAGLTPHLRRELFVHLGKTAVMARHIAPAFAGVDPATLQTLGVLHDIGRLALYGPGDEAFYDDPLAEKRALGVDHAVAGFAACAGFDLPDGLCQAVRLHHAPLYVEMEDLTDVGVRAIRYGLAVCVADQLVRALDADRPVTPLPLRSSYRFLVRESVLSRLVADSSLQTRLRQTMAMQVAASAS